MSASPFDRSGVPTGANSDAPLAVDLDRDTDSMIIPVGWASGLPSSWLRRARVYLVAAGFLGLAMVLTLVLTLTRKDVPTKASASVVTDNVVHLHASDIGESCWHGLAKRGTAARAAVSVDVGVDGKVRAVSATGESPAMCSCIESHVKTWKFLPQASASKLVLPFEVDPR